MSKGKRFKEIIRKEVHIKIINPRLVLLAIMLTIVFSAGGLIAYFTSTVSTTNTFTIEAEYTVSFLANGGVGQMNNQTISYNVPTHLSPNLYTNSGFTFNGWNTAADGSGTAYADGAEVNNLVSGNVNTITLYAQWISENAVAELNGVYYNSITLAIAAVNANDPQQTIKLLQSTSEMVAIPAGKNIVLNLQGHTLTNKGTGPFISNSGILTITNGTVKQNSLTDGAVTNNPGATIIIDGATIRMDAEGGKQALYNNGGTATIKGGAYLYSVSRDTGTNSRGTVHNKLGTLTILDCTIASPNNKGVVNEDILTIGSKDGNISRSSPIIQGTVNGLDSSTDYNLYDGIFKGKSTAIAGTGNILDTEQGYVLATSGEVIDGQNYFIQYLATDTVLVNFNANGGTTLETQRNVERGTNITIFPNVTYTGHIFDGWFTDPTTGVQVSENYTINQPETFYAHWTINNVAEYNGNYYTTLQAAINALPNNTERTITIIKDFSETVSVPASKKVIFDLQGHTISNNGSNPVFTVKGTVTVTNGIITSSATQGAINVDPTGKLTVNDAEIHATGSRQAIYNNGGTTEIKGNSELSSTSNERATVHNLNNGTVIITGGTITSTRERGIYNASGTVTIGIQDGNVDTTSPVIQGKTYGIDNSGTFNFYDGIFKGMTAGINGTVSDTEAGYQVITGTENIGGSTYNTAYLN